MANTWFYQHQGKTLGPVSAEDLKALAGKGLLDGDDLIWPEGADPAEATPAGATLDLSAAPPPAVPDWLADVAALERRGPTPPPPPPPAPSDWLDDLRVWIALEHYAAGKQAAAEAPPEPAPPAPLESPPAAPSARQEAGDRLADKAVQETGFDPRTGQVRDPERFRQWKVARAGSLAEVGPHTNASLMEAFRTARREIEAWVDDERHRAFLMERTPGQIVEIARVGGLLKKYDGYGPVLTDKLLQHLAFVVENRQKYYRASAGQ